MTVHCVAVLTCDQCGATIGDLPASGTLSYARWQHGWRRVQVGRAIQHDFCPDCWETWERELAVERVTVRQAARRDTLERQIERLAIGK